ncbi:bifunctional bis(5'-adenosyl)-triphosphatase/adenylylsulfatase FHIT isoform X2 [Coffea arabica]|uniref:Bis(5'-adenosyl)-triphosphatase n=1 Tax=Coffea arabica TaxID=13443 RepID=A0A6P6WE69_COFAR|nr:bifunctional bis(5'-adenosyl)-triphosphatase/adenylylsulfatase FHIT-like isoform X2 [Coffea arabica]
MLLVKQLVRVVPCLSSGVAIARGRLQISTGPYTAKLGSTTHRLIRRLSNSYSSNRMDTETYAFGPYKIDPKEVFYSTHLSYAMVNLRPLLPGHVLVCPRREVKRFVDLTADETSDLWLTAQKVGSQLESYHKASSLTFAIQDGPQAGQTVPHVHIHIVPRKGGDFEKNDEIYDAT